MGSGTWANTPEKRRQPIADSIINVRRWGHALFTERTPLDAFRRLDVPVLYLVGKRSTAAARGVASILMSALPKVRLVEFDELGHMGPITHPEVVNAEIKRFLERA
jgi:pimeloyl-ACP methyl ester carboxylesterase